MEIIRILLFVFLISVSVVIAKEDATGNMGNVENLKILRNSVNCAYKAGNEFLNLIRGMIPSYTATEQVFKLLKSEDGFKLMDLLPIYFPFLGYICLVLAGVLFIVLGLLVGFCFCCCRCTGKCGGKIKGMDPRHAKCKRYTYALLLGIVSIVQLAGIVLAFINNQLIHDTLTNPSQEISAVLQLTDGAQLLKGSLTNITDAIQAAEKSPINARGNKIDINFLNITCNSYFGVLKNKTDKLNIDLHLTTILKELERTIEYLNTLGSNTEKLKKYASFLRTEIPNLNSINIRPQVCEMISEFTKTEFIDLNRLIRDKVRDGSKTGDKLRKVVEFFNDTVWKELNNVVTKFNRHVKIDYLEYRMYICIGVCCLLLLIVLFYFLGLCFGQCGERPFEDARICNRGVGANLMMAGVAFAFLFTPIIMVLEVSLFLSGGAIQTELCRYFYDNRSTGVQTLDRVMQTIPLVANREFINNSIIDSIINRCPSEPMAVAFKLDSDLMTKEISSKISDIGTKVISVPEDRKNNIIDGHFKSLEGLLLNISAHISTTAEMYSGDDERSKTLVQEKARSISSAISIFSLMLIKEQFRLSFKNAAVSGVEPGLRSEAMSAIKGIYLGNYDNVRCDGISRSAVKVIDSVCVTFLWPYNGFWFGVGICLVFTIPAIIFAVKLAGLYRRTEKYSADYEEPDYQSYMGFYTNNADNIPMKRPKSAKTNQKNRNSNSNNNKDVVKQNNPQYLPVYPYDAYE